jgi:hypothetical protein
MAEDKENVGGVAKNAQTKLMPKVYYDPEKNDRNEWRQYKCEKLLMLALLIACFCVHLTYFFSLKPTFGRWSYKSGKPFFVAGPPPPSSEHKQPALELFSWKRFVDDGKDVRIVL